jgi:hypothetical protein
MKMKKCLSNNANTKKTLLNVKNNYVLWYDAWKAELSIAIKLLAGTRIRDNE